MRFGTTLARSFPASWTTQPNVRTGSLARPSATRPMTKTPSVNIAVKNGDENAEKSVANDATTATSHSVSSADAAMTLRSAGAGAARTKPSTTNTNAQTTG